MHILGKENYLEDVSFRKAIIEKLEELKNLKQTIIRKTAKQQGKLVSEIKFNSSPYGYLEDRGMLNVDTLLIECDKMLHKKSQLPSTVRRYLGDLYSICMSKAIMVNVEKDSKKFKK
jgi:hypothetical protein